MVQRTTRPEGESLDDLAGEAAELDAAAGEAEGGAQETALAMVENQKLTNGQILAGALTAGRDVFCTFTGFESPRTSLADANVIALADAWAPVLDKHGIDLAQYMGDYALEVAALLITAKIAIEVRSGVLAEMAQREKAKKVEPAAQNALGDGEAQA